MQVARISMGEYKSVDALDQFIEDYSKDFWELFPNVISASTIRTGSTLISNNTLRYFYLFFMRIKCLHKLILKLFSHQEVLSYEYLLILQRYLLFLVGYRIQLLPKLDVRLRLS